MDYELIDKKGSSLVLTTEDLHDNFFAKKTTQKFSVRAIFPCKLSESGQQKWIASK